MFKCLIFSLLKDITLIFNEIFDFFIILILMPEGFCLGAGASKAVALPTKWIFKIFQQHTNIA